MRNRWISALMALPAIFASLPVLAQIPADRSEYWHYGWDWGWGHMIFGSLMIVVFFGGLILVIVLAVRWVGGGNSQGTGSPPSRNRALDILQERFARGEIDKEDFDERKRLLSD